MSRKICNDNEIANIVFYNGSVITSDPNNTIVDSIAIKENKIIYVGPKKNIHKFIGENTQLIDLKNRSLLPGFIDSHVHLSIYGSNLLDVNCQESTIKSLKDLFNVLKQKTNQMERGKWIRAWSFDESKVKEKRFPTREELDKVSKHHPIIIVRACNHISVSNSKAFQLTGIDENTLDPVGGILERNHKGELTGKLIESAHMNISEKAAMDQEELKQSLKLASDVFIQYGITSIHDAGGYGDGISILKAMKDGVNSGDIKVRIYSMIGSLTDAEKFIAEVKKRNILTGDGNERLKVGPTKLFLDGSSTGPTIATREPYCNEPNNHGILYYSQDNIDKILKDSHNKGYQITAHAQGDRAIELMLNCIEKSLEENPVSDHRHRIEHAGIVPKDLLKRIKKLNVIVIPNPAFIYFNGDRYVEYYGNRVNCMYPLKDYKDMNIPMALGSDAPVVNYDPLIGIHAAVNRKSDSDKLIGKKQRIEILDAIKAYTIMGAYASFEEDIKGSLEQGKLADLVVLDSDILSVNKSNIKDIQVDITMIDGEIVYHRKE